MPGHLLGISVVAHWIAPVSYEKYPGREHNPTTTALKIGLYHLML